jgi:hypothetical protein
VRVKPEGPQDDLQDYNSEETLIPVFFYYTTETAKSQSLKHKII